MKTREIKIGLICLAIGILISSLIAYAATPSTTFYITGGIYPGAATFTLWREGSNYFAKNINGLIDYSGTNASDIIQDCLNDIPNDGRGGKLYFMESEYVINNMITINKYSVTLSGNGRGSQFITSENITMFYASAHGYLHLQNLGFRHGGGEGSVLWATNNGSDLFGHCRIENVYVENKHSGQQPIPFRGYAFNFTGNTWEVHITDSTINFGDYLLYYYGPELTISNTKFGAYAADGVSKVYLLECTWVNIVGCGFESLRLELINCRQANIVGNWWSAPPVNGMNLYQISNCTVTNNIIHDVVALPGSAWLYGIKFWGEADNMTYNIISHNIIHNILSIIYNNF